MTSSITDTHRSTTVTDVRQVTVSAPVEVDGKYRRAIRVLGDTGGDQPAEMIELVIVSDNREDLAITAPEQRF